MIVRHNVEPAGYIAREIDWPVLFPLQLRKLCIDSAATLVNGNGR